jgi:hypothetical protein
VPFTQEHYESIIDFLCTIQGDYVSSDNIALKLNDVSVSKTCNFDNFVTTNIINTIDESKVFLTQNEMCMY